MDPFYLSEAEWEIVLDIYSCIRVMCQFRMFVESVTGGVSIERNMPLQPSLLPFLIPFQFRTRTDEKLKFHLLEFSHAHNELPSNHFVSKSFSDLGNAEGDFHPSALLHIEKIHKNALRGLWTKIDGIGVLCRSPHLGREHEIELAHLRPIFGARYGADDVLVFDDRFQPA